MNAKPTNDNKLEHIQNTFQIIFLGMLRQPMITSGIAIVVQSYITKVTNKAMNNDDVPETNDRETNLAMMLIFINCESKAFQLKGFFARRFLIHNRTPP